MHLRRIHPRTARPSGQSERQLTRGCPARLDRLARRTPDPCTPWCSSDVARRRLLARSRGAVFRESRDTSLVTRTTRPRKEPARSADSALGSHTVLLFLLVGIRLTRPTAPLGHTLAPLAGVGSTPYVARPRAPSGRASLLTHSRRVRAHRAQKHTTPVRTANAKKAVTSPPLPRLQRLPPPARAQIKGSHLAAHISPAPPHVVSAGMHRCATRARPLCRSACARLHATTRQLATVVTRPVCRRRCHHAPAPRWQSTFTQCSLAATHVMEAAGPPVHTSLTRPG